MRYLIFFSVIMCIYSCSTQHRPDIILDDFETGNFDKWNIQGTAFQLPRQVDSIEVPVKNYQGKYFAFSDFEKPNLKVSQGLNQGKLISEPFVINRKYITFLIAGGRNDIRTCVSLLIDNKVVKLATGENDFELREVSWDVSNYEGELAVLEIVDGIPSREEIIGRIIIDNIVFTDNSYQRELIFEDFESGTYNNWKVEGDAFSIPRNRTNVYYPISTTGFTGDFFAFSFGDTHDEKQGKLISKPFTIDHDFIKFIIGGGKHEGKTCINLVVGDSVVFSNVGQNDGQMRPHSWDVIPYRGRRAHVEIVDKFSGSWGHIMVDDIIFYDAAPFYITSKFWSYLLILILFLYIPFKYFNINKGNKILTNNFGLENSEKTEKLKLIIKESMIHRKYNASINDIDNIPELDKTEIETYFEPSGIKSFNHYLNILRVEDFKQQLEDSSNTAYTIVSISEKCGFNSKTSFYRVFKSITNMTPSEYIKKIG